MAKQLVYTSAPTLLEAGRSGFGTVARHEFIRPALQAELERISQFSREHGQSKDRILFYHRVMDLRGERFHVLSRIRDAGADYTGRTNHIAHHIVLTDAEAAGARDAGCTPVDVILWLTEHNFWRDQWHEPAHLINEEIAIGSLGPKVELRPNEGAVTWGEVTGSAANAAILAPGGAAAEGCWILCGDEQARQILPLIGESLRLHPDPWAISFSTDTQPTDRIEEIRWRGVSIGSPLERTARDSVRPCLDLGSPATLPTPVEQFSGEARTGLKKAPPPASAHRRAKEKEPALGMEQVFQGEGMVSVTVSLSERMKKKGYQPKATMGSKGKTQGKGFLPVVIGMIAMILLLLVGGVCYFWMNCLLNPGDINGLEQATRTIIRRITDNKGDAPSVDWFSKQVPQWTLGDFQFVSPESKAIVTGTRNNLKSLQEVRDPATLAEKIKEVNLAGLPGLEGAILRKITEAKNESDARIRAQTPQKETTKRISKNEPSPQTGKRPAGAKPENRNEKEQNSQTNAPAKITGICFKQLKAEQDPLTEFFPGTHLPANAAGWFAINVSTNPLLATNGLESKTNWLTNVPSDTGLGMTSAKQFRETLKTNAWTAFATKDPSNAISVTILPKQGQSWTNSTGAFTAEIKDEKSGDVKVTLNPAIAGFLHLITNATVKYKIMKDQEVCKSEGKPLTGTNLEELGKQIADCRRTITNKISEFNNTLKSSSNDDPNGIKECKEHIYNVNKIYDGLKLINDKGKEKRCSDYTSWLKENAKQQESLDSYKEYIIDVFHFSENYFGEQNSVKYYDFFNLGNSIQKCETLENVITSIRNKQREINSSIQTTDKYGGGHGQKKTNDQKFLQNLNDAFEFDLKYIDKVFMTQKADTIPEPRAELVKIDEILADLKKTNPSTYKPRIEILDGTNPILIFTTP